MDLMPARPDATGEKKPEFSLPSSLSAVVGELSSTAEAIRDVIHDTSVIAERTARFYADAEEAQRTTIEVQKQFLDQFKGMAGDYMDGPRAPSVPAAGVVPASVREATPKSFKGPPGFQDQRSVQERESQFPLSRSPFAGPTEGESGKDFYDRMRRYDVTTARSDAGRWAQEKVGTWADKALPEYDGPVKGVNEAGQTAWFRPDGTEITDPGEVFDAQWEAEEYAAKASSGAGRLALMGRTIGQQGLGKGLMSAAPAGALKAGGIATAAFSVADQAKDFAIAQRQANLSWQRTLGGDNAEGFGERAQSQLFEMKSSWFGGMGAETASDLYAGAAGIYGMDRDMRGATQTFGTQMFSRHGMSVEESLHLVSLAAESGSEAFGNLSEAIHGVSETAREAGVNAEEAQKAFQANYEQLVQTGVGGPGNAAGIAAITTNLTTEMGRRFGDVSLGGMFTDANMRQMASLLGMDYPDFYPGISRPGGTDLAARGLAALATKKAGHVIGPEQVAWIKRRRGELADDAGNIDPADLQQMGLEMMEEFGIAPEMAKSMATATTGGSKQFTDAGKAMEWLIETGSGSFAERTRQGSEEWTETRLQQDITTAEGQTDALATGEMLQSFFGSDSKGGRTGDLIAYYEWAQKSGKTNPIVEGLLKDHKTNRRYVVQTKDGPRQVTLGEAIKNDYLDQFYKGDVMISEGTGEGQTVGQLLPELNEISALEAQGAATADGNDPSSERGATVGKEIDPEDISGDYTGKVLVEVDPWLKQWLNVNAFGSAVLSPPSGDIANGFVGN